VLGSFWQFDDRPYRYFILERTHGQQLRIHAALTKFGFGRKTMLHCARNHALLMPLLFLSVAACARKDPLDNAAFRNPQLPIEHRVSDLLGRMTAEEKASMLAGANWMESQPIERLAIPAIKMADGPMGIRAWYGPSALTNAANSQLPKVESTSFPAGIAMAATWNPDLVEGEGKVIGQETRSLGRDMILGPTVNIARVPVWGRNFEGYGEDPFLTSRMAVAFIKGAQDEGIIATAKHFAANNQEFERHRIDEKIDERALHEIYLPAFKAAVQEAGVLSVMSAYNKINGLYCAENAYLLDEVLRKQWGFKGFVVSDWGGTYSTAGSIKAGLNLEMPGGQQMLDWIATDRVKAAGNSGGWLMQAKVLSALSSGQVDQQTIDQRVADLLRVMFQRGFFEGRPAAAQEVDTAGQKKLARAAAAEGIVLLKNGNNLLPLSPNVRIIAVIGPNAAVARTGGGGSSLVRPKYAVAPLDGMRTRAGEKWKIDYAQGLAMEGEKLDQDAATAKKEAVAKAAKADVAIVFVGYSPTLESESFDRKTLDLPAGQDELILAVAEANKNTVVVIQAGSPIKMSKWLNRVSAVVEAWYGGQECGNAIADVLFGDVNPSGKLPVSFPKELKDTAAFRTYPGENLRTEYAEGIYVGYRHFDKMGIEPLFPFGFGLSYTKFDYSDLTVTPKTIDSSGNVQVALKIRNTGKMAGAEVVQVYMRDVESSLDRPFRELKAFRKVFLKQGESQIVNFALGKDSLSYYDSGARSWVAEPGVFEVQIGSSSQDIRCKAFFALK
jgi:beta-glucosidase